MGQFKAVIVGKKLSEIMSKENGGTYGLIDVEILDGPAKGQVVAGTFTTKNANGEERDANEIAQGQEVSIYHQAVPSNKPGQEGKFMHFFEISTGRVRAENDELTALLGASIDADQAI